MQTIKRTLIAVSVVALFLSCNDKEGEKLLMAYEIGWKEGASGVINLINERKNVNDLILKVYAQDSTRFVEYYDIKL